MARRQASRPAARAPAPAPKAAAPAPAPPVQQHAQVPAVQQPQQPGLFANMASTAAGVAVGSTVGHVIGGGISSLFGGGNSQPQTVQQPAAPVQQQVGAACEPDNKAFMRCLDANQNNISACQFYLDMLKQCQADARIQ
ncbi:hypothetical protein HDV04_002713 [Boothiomyces sp. JEL0838]|nr:hypothetical protein HDV04_002713 [Boothiomyces sp. JEL0838]